MQTVWVIRPLNYIPYVNAGEFLLSPELTPTRHYDATEVLAKAKTIASYVDIVQ